jgi:hypothetical protein
MVTLLKHPRGLGVGYKHSAIGSYNFADSRDDLLHGLLTRKLGTCASLPVLFVAIGRRLGWPMHLAVAKAYITGVDINNAAQPPTETIVIPCPCDDNTKVV